MSELDPMRESRHAGSNPNDDMEMFRAAYARVSGSLERLKKQVQETQECVDRLALALGLKSVNAEVAEGGRKRVNDRTRQVFLALEKGDQTVPQICERTGLRYGQVHDAIQILLRERRAVRVERGVYALKTESHPKEAP